MLEPAMLSTFRTDGFEVIPSVLSFVESTNLRQALASLKIAPGHRNLMGQVPEIATLAASSKILARVGSLLGKEPFAVRSIFFDKTPQTNWLVPWHQDLSIAVKERRDSPGYGPWSIKEGTHHVQPPLEILESMATIRLHLDDCGETNGPLRVIPGSHRWGKLAAAQIAEIRSQTSEVACLVHSGDALIMRPLLLHASSEARIPAHRRVIHLEYATSSLANGLTWVENASHPILS